MGAAIGDALRANGHDVIWASEGRSDATRARAAALPRRRDASRRSSARPRSCSRSARRTRPLDVARATCRLRRHLRRRERDLAAPRRRDRGAARRVTSTAASSARRRAPPATTRLYLSGARRSARGRAVRRLDRRRAGRAGRVGAQDGLRSVVEGHGGAAARDARRRRATSASRTRSRRSGACPQPELFERLAAAERSAATKGWRWVGEMEEIADTFAAAGEPAGFHRAAAEVYRS